MEKYYLAIDIGASSRTAYAGIGCGRKDAVGGMFPASRMEWTM